jgi:SWI/SNF-related matrix-associated actin-dependent regulator 1 of chromatin subfamily A
MKSIKSKLPIRDYQTKGVQFLLGGQRKLLLDDQGIGKTAQSVVAFSSLGAKKVLILCPSATRYGWEEEVKKWDTRGYRTHVMTRTSEWIPEGAQVVIVSYSLVNSKMILDQLKRTRWVVTVADEIHFLKNSKAQRTKNILGRGGVISKSVYFWGLSGTLMPNTPIDLWQCFRSMGKAHLPEKARDYNGFTRIFCNRYKTRFGWDVSGAKNLPLLNKCLFDSGFALRRTKEQVLKELPEKTYRLLPMENSADSPAEIKWGDTIRKLNPINLGLGAGELAEARKDLSMEKLDATLQYIKSIETPVVVFGWHREFLEALHDETDSVIYYGSMSPTQKEEAKRQFTEGVVKIFIANIQSAGTGLNGLQHVSSHAIFAESPWTWAEIEQAADRLHRMGQKNPVLVDILCMRGGIEEYILKAVVKKQGYFNKVFDESKSLL